MPCYLLQNCHSAAVTLVININVNSLWDVIMEANVKKGGGRRCCAYKCGNLQTKDCGITFHGFPLNDTELCAKWVNATKWEGFIPTKYHFLCRQHFTPDDFYFSDSKKPKPGAVPTIFAFPEQVQSHENSRKRKAPTTRTPLEIPEKKSKVELTTPIRRKSPTKEDLLKRIKVLQQKVRRKEKKITSLKSMLDELVQKQLLTEDVSANLAKSFTGLPLDFIHNHYSNQGRKAKGYRHCEEVKRFALTLNFYSPKAYDYVRSVFKTLPHPSSMANWTSSIKCDPGFFEDVFREVRSRTEKKKYEREVTLVCDAMGIMENVAFNRSTGTFTGFVDLGENIVVSPDQEDTPAKNALVFMLVSLRAYWKYPIGYVFIDGIDAATLHALLRRALDLCLDHELDVLAVTMDGTTTNFSAMRKFGCKLGGALDKITGKFTYGSFSHPIVFTPDVVHMLKLGRNALADLGSFTDKANRKIEWRFISQLHDVQEEVGFKFGNKIHKNRKSIIRKNT